MSHTTEVIVVVLAVAATTGRLVYAARRAGLRKKRVR
jgi:hypothetical protein